MKERQTKGGAQATVLDILKKIIDGFLAGALISIGGAVFLACYGEMPPIGKYVGAVFFCTALLCICIKGFSLYTGKIGYVLEKHSKEDISVMLLGLLGNFIGTVACGYLLAAAVPSLKDAAFALCDGKLQSQEWWQTLVRAFFCGILVFLAVDIYRNHKTPLGVVFCIPAFILSGYEHSIADMFYFAASGIASGEALLFIWLVILGNSLGGLMIPALKLVGAKKPAATQEPAAQNLTAPHTAPSAPFSTKDGTRSEATKYATKGASVSSPAEPLSQAEEPTSDENTPAA